MKCLLCACKVICLAFILVFFVTARPAHAYLDPGTGSYIFQIIIAGVVAGAFALKCTWGRIRTSLKGFLARKSKKTPQDG